jgi:trehalose 6-phosphate synthase
MDRGERERRLAGLQAIVTARDPGDWIDEQLADIGAKSSTGAGKPVPSPPD